MHESSCASYGRTVRVAVTGVSGDVGLGSIFGLRAADFACWILGLDYNADCAGFHLCDAHQQVKGVADPGYAPQLVELLARHKIDVLLCGIDSELSLLARWRARIKAETGCEVVVGQPEEIDRFADKLLTTRWLEAAGLTPPRTWEVAPGLAAQALAEHLPLIAKPRRGNASKGVSVLAHVDQLARFLDSAPQDYCLQELIEGPEYTCGLLFDSTGALKDWMCARRELLNGRTMFAEVVRDEALDLFVQRFGALARTVGSCNIQLRKAPDGTPKVFDVNPRLSGSTSMRIAVGFNDPARIAAHWAFGLEITRACVRPARIYRYLTELVV